MFLISDGVLVSYIQLVCLFLYCVMYYIRHSALYAPLSLPCLSLFSARHFSLRVRTRYYCSRLAHARVSERHGVQRGDSGGREAQLLRAAGRRAAARLAPSSSPLPRQGHHSPLTRSVSLVGALSLSLSLSLARTIGPRSRQTRRIFGRVVEITR